MDKATNYEQFKQQAKNLAKVSEVVHTAEASKNYHEYLLANKRYANKMLKERS